MAANQSAVITYYLRAGANAQKGDGINRARAEGLGGSTVVASAQAVAKVQVQDKDLMTQEACIMGKVFTDCNRNHIQDKGEPGIPGVRLYTNTGLFAVTDEEGKYSLCGLPARNHVVKVDKTTLPKGAKLVTSSNQNFGDPGSLVVDLGFGEIRRADFVEGTCHFDVLQQVNDKVKDRRDKANQSGVNDPMKPVLNNTGAAKKTGE